MYDSTEIDSARIVIARELVVWLLVERLHGQLLPKSPPGAVDVSGPVVIPASPDLVLVDHLTFVDDHFGYLFTEHFPFVLFCEPHLDSAVRVLRHQYISPPSELAIVFSQYFYHFQVRFFFHLLHCYFLYLYCFLKLPVFKFQVVVTR